MMQDGFARRATMAARGNREGANHDDNKTGGNSGGSQGVQKPS